MFFVPSVVSPKQRQKAAAWSGRPPRSYVSIRTAVVHLGRERLSVVGSRLEGRAFGGVACCGAGGTYNDLVGGAVAIAVVVCAVFNVADYAFDVLATALFVIYVGVQLFFHFVLPFLAWSSVSDAGHQICRYYRRHGGTGIVYPASQLLCAACAAGGLKCHYTQ